MRNHSRLALMMGFSLTIAACGGGFKARMEVTDAVRTNAAVLGHIEWESSDAHPVRIFARWHLQKTSPEDICAALLAQSPQDLTLFEEEIKKPENARLLGPCKERLDQTIGDYWETQKPSRLEDAAADFRFQGIEVTRDFENGYFIVNGDLGPKQVLLTFDDGPHPEYTKLILDNLRETNAKSIFLHLGKQARAYPDIVRRVAREGHGVGSHSMSHRCLAAKGVCQKNSSNKGHMLSFAEAIAEIRDGHQAVFDVLGWVDPFFRFPYGESSIELRKFLNTNSTGEFFWSIDSTDWRSQSPAQMISGVMAQLNAKGRGVILFHDIQHRTALAVPQLLRELYFGGYQVVLMKPSNPQARYQSKLVMKKHTPEPPESPRPPDLTKP